MKWFATVIFLLLWINCFAQGVPLAYDVENTGADCPEPLLPSFSELPVIESLPDPFAWSDSSRGRITSYADWRVTETLEGERETLSNAQGAPWYRENLSLFNEAVTKLPYDHHELMAMVAPRALFVLGNPDYEWLAEESGHVACKAAQEVWDALGVADRFGFSKVGGHKHCQLPESQVPEVAAFVEKFLLGNDSANTNIARSPYNTDLSRWITWETPDLADIPTSAH